MKSNIPGPAIAGVVAVVVAIIAFFFIRGVTVEPHTPRPDPALFGGKKMTGPPDESVSGAQTPLNSTGAH